MPLDSAVLTRNFFGIYNMLSAFLVSIVELKHPQFFVNFCRITNMMLLFLNYKHGCRMYQKIAAKPNEIAKIGYVQS